MIRERRRRVSTLFLALLFLATVLEGEEIGRVAALAESVAIVRAGEPIPGAVEGGTALKAEDLLLTGEGYGEVILDGLGRLRLWPETVVHLRGSVEIELLTGTVQFRRLGGSGPVPILSGAVTVRIRSGEATVTADAGDLRLVLSESGRQPVLSETGVRRFAEPGRPVGFYRRLSNIEGAPLEWREAALKTFATRGPGEMADRFQEYRELRERFDTAYEELLRYRSTLNRWRSEFRRGLDPKVEETLTGEPELSAALDGVLGVSEEMERRYYQLRLDAPYLREEFREYLRQEDAYLTDRLHFVRFLRALLPAGALDQESA
ncbi:MAG: hypothetical protein ACOC25_05575 [Alkalispirochaetaceae bacterium]